jgi:hypothetical protein
MEKKKILIKSEGGMLDSGVSMQFLVFFLVHAWMWMDGNTRPQERVLVG